MDMTFTTEFAGSEEEWELVESWCRERLRGWWRLCLRDVPDEPAHGFFGGYHVLHIITVSTPEDHALVQLTWG
jgi:hypothetical protein